MYKIGVDVGGTFTDFFLADELGNSMIHKTATTPQDPSIGVINGLIELAAVQNSKLTDFLQQVDAILHGTTITTNSMLTGTYAKTGLLNTKGFRDVIRFRTGRKRHAYFHKEDPPRPLVSRRLSLGVEGRIDCEGKEVTPLNEADVYTAAERFRKENVESVAVSFIFSFLNPLHEQRASEILEKELPGVYLSQSHEVLPKAKLYPRTSTTVLNANVGPGLRAYLENLLDKLEANGFRGLLRIMQSNGGVMAPELAIKSAVNTILSGPAAGPTAGIYYAGLHDCVDLITIDMGGTSFDSCPIRSGVPDLSTEMEIVEYELALSAIGVKSIGAGGGSIVWIDQRGILQVGPQSAGAEPGPACYGKGGEEATVTDADLVLGYLDADYFLGGRAKLYHEKAERAIRKRVADRLKVNVREAAYGIYRLVNANMAQGVRLSLIERGYGPRNAAMVIAGGAGPVHGAAIAREFGIPLVLIPKQSSVFCAAGILMSNLRHEIVKTLATPIDERLDLDRLNTILGEMREDGFAQLQRENIPQDRMTVAYSADLRYAGQLHELEIPLPTTDGHFTKDNITRLLNDFHKMHEISYGYSVPGYSVDCLFLRVRVEGITDKVSLKETAFLGKDASRAQKGQRKVLLEAGETIEVPIYDGNKLGNGNRIAGPAIIEEPTTTIVVPQDYDVECDRYDTYLMHPKSLSLEEALGEVRRAR